MAVTTRGSKRAKGESPKTYCHPRLKGVIFTEDGSHKKFALPLKQIPEKKP